MSHTTEQLFSTKSSQKKYFHQLLTVVLFLFFFFRGFESETDTEEFEKVGQSPTDMVFEKTESSAQEVSTEYLWVFVKLTDIYIKLKVICFQNQN